MNKIEQILCRRSIDGAKQIRQLFNNWSDEEIVQFYRELESYASQQMPSEEEILTSAKIRAKSVHNLLHKEISDYFMEGVNYVLHLKSLQQENQTED